MFSTTEKVYSISYIMQSCLLSSARCTKSFPKKLALISSFCQSRCIKIFRKVSFSALSYFLDIEECSRLNVELKVYLCMTLYLTSTEKFPDGRKMIAVRQQTWFV